MRALGRCALGMAADGRALAAAGLMYDPADARRSAAFLIFYCAINLGAFMSPLVSGVLHATLGFRAGFYASSAAVALGLVQYAAGLRHLPPDRLLRDHRGSDTAEHGPARAPRTFGSLVRHHRARLLAIAAVCVLTVGFWGVYEQQGNTLPVYADQVSLHAQGRTTIHMLHVSVLRTRIYVFMYMYMYMCISIFICICI